MSFSHQSNPHHQPKKNAPLEAARFFDQIIVNNR